MTGTDMFVASGSLFVFASVAFVIGFRSARMSDWARAVGAAGLGAVLAFAGAGLFWLGSTHPAFNVRNNQGFPADWSCAPVARGPVCAQDVPRPVAPTPAR